MSASSENNYGFWKPKATTSVIEHDNSRSQRRQNDGYDNYTQRDDTNDSPPVFNFSRAPIARQRMLLPIYKHKRQILYSMEQYGIVIIVGETGCGKSTQIPQYLYENGWCDETFQVVCTQPRRIAAQTLAQRVSVEVGKDTVGGTVGYSVRFDNKFSSTNTRIKYMTDGMLVREASTSDPLLSQYSVVMIDEAHERNVNTDILLGLIKKIRRKRPQLRVIVCSATIDAKAFLDFFLSGVQKSQNKKKRKREQQTRWGPRHDTSSTSEYKNRDTDDNHADIEDDDVTNRGTIISVDGRQHSVDILYLQQPAQNYIKCMVETVFQIHQEDMIRSGVSSGDILCFLPTGEDVDEAIRLAEEQQEFDMENNTSNYDTNNATTDSKKQKSNNNKNNKKRLLFLSLYSALPYNMQARVFQMDEKNNDHRSRGRNRRVIFATNIAETSVTVPRITHVIDSGLVKLPYFDAKTDFERLIVVPISQASAQQRAGRAGRVQAGKCYRLYTESFYFGTTGKDKNKVNNMPIATPPEILRTNVTSLILTLKALGVDNILAFDLMDLPSIDALSHALESLYALGALDDQTNLTKLGLDMSAFPTEPRVSRMLLESIKEGCSWEVLAIASALQARSLFVQPRGLRRRPQQQLEYDEAISQVADTSGDHVTYANILDESDEQRWDRQDCKERYINFDALRRIKDVRNQLARFLRRFGKVQAMGTTTTMMGTIVEDRSRAIRKCVTAGFFFSIAKLGPDGRYYAIRRGTASGNKHNKILVTPSQSSVFHSHGSPSEFIIFCETHDGTRGGIELRSVSTIDPRWLRELAPHYWE